MGECCGPLSRPLPFLPQTHKLLSASDPKDAPGEPGIELSALLWPTRRVDFHFPSVKIPLSRHDNL